MRDFSCRPGIYGYLALLIGTVALFSFSPIPVQLGYAAGLALWSALFNRRALGKVLRLPMFLFIVSILGISVVWNLQAPGETLSSVEIGLLMAIRTVSIFIAVQIVSGSISVYDLSKLMDSLGLNGFGFTAGIALHILPLAQTTARQTFEAMQLRGAFAHHRFRNLGKWISTVFIQVLKQSDHIVAAARSRAYGSRSIPRSFPAIRFGDILLIFIFLSLLIGFR